MYLSSVCIHIIFPLLLWFPFISTVSTTINIFYHILTFLILLLLIIEYNIFEKSKTKMPSQIEPGIFFKNQILNLRVSRFRHPLRNSYNST